MAQKIIVREDGSLKLPGMFYNIIKNPNDIMCIKVVNKKSTIMFKNSECWEKTLGLSDFELVLDMSLFYRSCDNHLMHPGYVKSHHRNGRGLVAVLVNRKPQEGAYIFSIEVPVSVRKVDGFLKRYNARNQHDKK
jgi:hypothetical protein